MCLLGAGVKQQFLGSIIRAARKVPGVAGAVNAELQKTLTDLEADLRIKDDEVIYSIPEEGWSHEKVLEVCRTLKATVSSSAFSRAA